MYNETVRRSQMRLRSCVECVSGVSDVSVVFCMFVEVSSAYLPQWHYKQCNSDPAICWLRHITAYGLSLLHTHIMSRCVSWHQQHASHPLHTPTPQTDSSSSVSVCLRRGGSPPISESLFQSCPAQMLFCDCFLCVFNPCSFFRWHTYILYGFSYKIKETKHVSIRFLC